MVFIYARRSAPAPATSAKTLKWPVAVHTVHSFRIPVFKDSVIENGAELLIVKYVSTAREITSLLVGTFEVNSLWFRQYFFVKSWVVFDSKTE